MLGPTRRSPDKAEPRIDTRITVSIASSGISDVTASTVCTRITVSVFPGFTSKPGVNASTSRNRLRPSTIPFSGEQSVVQSLAPAPQLGRLHRIAIPHHEPELTHNALRQFATLQRCQPGGLELGAATKRPSPDLLRWMSETEHAERLLCVYELHLRVVFRVRPSNHQWSEQRAHEHVSEVQCNGFEFQNVPAGSAMSTDDA